MTGIGAERSLLPVAARLAVTIVVGVALAIFWLLPRTPPAVRLHGAAGDGNVTLSWSLPDAVDGIKRWQYRQRLEGDRYGESMKLPGSGVVEGLTNGRSYGFRVRAENAHGWGAWSNEVTVAPRALPEDATERELLQAIAAAASRMTTALEEIGAGADSVKSIASRTERIRGLLASIDERLRQKAECSEECGGGGGGGGGGITERELLPVHLRVHFENAELDAQSGQPSDRGVALTSMQQSLLQSTVNTLGSCTLGRSTVRIKPYGFASSAPFRGVPNSDELNVAAANRRAAAVRAALKEMSKGNENLLIEAPAAWRDFGEMEAARNRCVTASQEGRYSFPGRVVVLQLEEWGACTPASGAELLPPCDA